MTMNEALLVLAEMPLGGATREERRQNEIARLSALAHISGRMGREQEERLLLIERQAILDRDKAQAEFQALLKEDGGK